jgi:hypothetical protein
MIKSGDYITEERVLSEKRVNSYPGLRGVVDIDGDSKSLGKLRP